MKIALWGAGAMLNQVIDNINTKIHRIEYLIDSDPEKSGKSRYGIQIKHYQEADFERIDCIIITTKHASDVLQQMKYSFPGFHKPVFCDMDHFLAYEYVHILHPEIRENPLYSILEQNHFEYQTDKRLQYLETYHRYFSRFQNKNTVFMEIGVYEGGSMPLWKEYFGKNSTIIGIDINENCVRFEEDQIKIEIGSQESNYFWNYIKEKYPKVDILLDDGGHTMNQQITTFLNMFEHLSRNGIYLCEDVFTSYWPNWGGAYKNPSTFIEFAKDMVDDMNTQFAQGIKYYKRPYTDSVKSVLFEQGIVVIEKGDPVIKLDNTLLRGRTGEIDKYES